MSTLADVNTAMRERVTHLERRYGRKRVYLVSGIVAISGCSFGHSRHYKPAESSAATASPSRFGCEGDQQRRSTLFG